MHNLSNNLKGMTSQSSTKLLNKIIDEYSYVAVPTYNKLRNSICTNNTR